MYLFMPQAVRKVARGEIQLHNNLYFSQDLQEYHGDSLRVAYNIHNAEWVWLFDDDGRFVCKAQWNGNRIDYMPKPFIEQAKDKRVDAQVKRLETKISVVEAARPAKVLEHQQSSLNLGGMRVDLNDLPEILPKAAPKQPENPPKAVILERETEQEWQLPATPEQRFALWQQYHNTGIYPKGAERWVSSYPRTPEFADFSQKAA